MLPQELSDQSTQLDMTGSRNLEIVLDMKGSLLFPTLNNALFSTQMVLPAFSISVAMSYLSLWHLSPGNI